MSDPKLIDRLRAHAEAHEYIANADSDQRQWMHDLYDAADEIESLRQQLAQSQQESQDKAGELIAEIHTNDELRAQLAEAKQRLEKQDAALTMWEEKVKRIQAGLKQPGIVLNNILRGEIVLPESYGRLVELRNRIAELERQPDESIAEAADELRDMATWFDQCGKQCNGDFLRTCASKLEILHGAYSTATHKLSEANHDH